MADFTALKTAIQTYIKQNGNEEITGEILQEILLSVVTTLGDGAINDLITALGNEVTARQQADGTLQQDITNEATARGNADTALSNRLGSTITAENTAAEQIGAEEEAREAADTALQGLIDGITDNIENGYVYAGIATPSSTPTTGKVFYLALTAGTYTNFGSTVVSQGINILKYNGSAWSLDAFVGIDDTPTPSSNNLVKSGGVFNDIMTNGSAFDLTAYNNGTTYADLNAALTALNALPAAYKKGGMSMKYVQTSDNKYVQFRYMSSSTAVADFTNVANWQSMNVDDVPTANSNNLIKSSGVWNELEGIEGERIELSVGVGAVRIDGTTDYSSNFCKMYQYEVTDETEVEYLLHAHYRGSNNVWLAAIACYDSSWAFMPNESLSGEVAVVGEKTLFTIPQGVKYLIVSTFAEYQSTDGLYTKSIKGVKPAISELEDEVTNIENEITDINRKINSKLIISEGQNIPIQSYDTCEKIEDTYKVSTSAKLGFQTISSAKTFGLWIFAAQRNIDNITSIVFTLSASDKASGHACTMLVNYAKGIRNGWNFVKFYCPQDFSTENINANSLYIDINAVENTSPTIVVKDIVINQKCKPIVLINYDQMWQNAENNGVYQYHKDHHIPCTIFSHWNTNLITSALLDEARDMHDNYECELGTYGSFDTTLNPLPTTTDLPTAVEDVVSNASRCMNIADDIVTSYSCTTNKSTPTIEQAIKINGFVIGRDSKLSDTGNSFFDKNSMWLGTISYGRYGTKWLYQQYLTRIIDGGYIGVIMTHDVEDTPSADYNDSTEVWMDLLSKVKTYRDNGDIEPMTFRDFYKLVV